ncbi:hypothetical protein EDD22DRAFT_851631 [Suillus occidentalis]|nr:hypothetical protein EDD22DRAFT_851631 [Suillus occidentalis]
MDTQIHLTDSLFGCRSNVRWVHHVETKKSFIIKDTWHNVHEKMTEGQILCVIAGIANIPELVEEYIVISQFQSRAGLAKALKDCIIETGNDGGEIGDWGFAECQDLHIVQQRLQPLNQAFPKKAELIIPTSSPMPIVSSLKLMPPSPELVQLCKMLYNESGPDAQQMSISDPWDIRSWAGTANPNIDLAKQTGNAVCVSVRLMYAAAIDQFCSHEVHDDLESFFYAIVIIMVAFHEASKQKSTEELEEMMLADHWWNQQHWRSSAEWKVTTMKQDALWKSHIAPHIDRGTPALIEVASSSLWEESHASFFSLLEAEVGDDIDPRSILEDKLALQPTDAISYTPTEVFKISSVLNAVATTSELPKDNVQLEPINKPPSRAVIKKTSHGHPPATIFTGNLPTEESTITDSVTNDTSNAMAGSSKHKAPDDVDNNTRKKSHASEKNLLANEGGKKSHGGKKSITSNWVKKFCTSDGGKKKSTVIDAAGKKSGISHSHCNDDEDYVPVKASTSRKRKI